MNRRSFLSVAPAAGGAASVSFGQASGPAGGKRAGSGAAKARMVVGCQRGPTSDEMLAYFKRHGVEHICGHPAASGEKGYWDRDDLMRLRERVDRHGIRLMMIEPEMSSAYITRARRASIMLGQDPDRDRQIDLVCKTIRAAAEAGIPALKYNLTVLGVVRTASATGRGGVKLSTWKYSEAKQDPPLTEAGPMPAERMWERITYFLERVIPVAVGHRIRMACHPHDPGMPPRGFRGVDRVLGTVAGLRKLLSIKESPYHGLNFCQGTVAEMLADPGKEIYAVIREFAQRKKIFNVHFRNIRGRRDDFVETFPDEGDVDMWRALLEYKRAGYDGMLMPDHMPAHPDDPGSRQAFAYGYGYIRAMIQAAEALG
ncbi:MAG: D-mannonate dehydratase [Candidatus Solibacter sp.]|nr:D-mannonate dehydratase [Candidatus Solibacter sp.]